MRTAVIIAAGAACLTLAGCTSFGSSGGGSSGASSGAPTSGNLAASVSAAVSSAFSPANAIAGWWVDPTRTDFQAVVTDEGNISTAAGNSDAAGLTAACGALKADVVRFEADPAAPDAELRSDLAQAMDAYSTAATQCLSGDFNAAGDAMTQGNGFVDRATARMKSFLP